ncbi:MAG TPA: MFS transporter [Actinomycetota bacterium]|jgi:MFS family permease
MPTVQRAREVVRTRDFRLLFGARVASQFADGLFQAVIVASVIFAPDKQSTAVGFAKATAVLVVPYSIIGPFAGVFVDRWRRESILRWTPLVRGAAAVLLLGGAGATVPFYAGALLVLSANRFFLVTAGTVTPRVVHPDDLLVANSLNSVGGTVSTIVGVAIGGWVADAAGFRTLIVACVVLWAVTSLVVGRIRSDLSADRSAIEPLLHAIGVVARELRAGARVLAHTPRALGPITSYSVDQFLQGLVLVMSFVVFKERFQEGVGSYSQLIAAGAVGGFLGLGTVGWLDSRLSRPRMVAAAFLVSGVPLIVISPFITGWTVLVASFCLGVGFAWKKVPIDTMVQTAVSDRYRGRVFAIYDVAQNLARVLAALLAIAVVRDGDVGLDAGLIGLAYVLYAPVLPIWLRRTAALEVRTYSGGRADEGVRSVVVGGEESAVTVERSWHEERAGARLLCFRLRLDDGSRIEVSRPEDGDGRWRLDRELPADRSTAVT